MTTSMVFQFVCYVFAFWGLWKAFDSILHLCFWIKDPNQCNGCHNKQKDIRKLKDEVKKLTFDLQRKVLRQIASDLPLPDEARQPESTDSYLMQRAKMAETKASQWRDVALEHIAVQKLNTCSPQEIEQIYGCGPISVKKIVESRPVKSIEQVDRLIPGQNAYHIKRWAEQSIT